MTRPAIYIEHLSKTYQVQHQTQERYRVLRDVVSQGVKRLCHPSTWARTSTVEEFYALNDVNLEIQPGDRVGIVGKNGAGKSTLLKIISRITEPTAGKVTIRGRVASLLEIGTGFHPELTGRENVYLSAAILGMSRAEIQRKFDAIVAYAEVEKFVDMAVKRYSSGMYLRLAFAVAAHLEPDILLVDEVLAVGDIEFQKKCFGTMQGISRQGHTVLFVSHNMAPIQQLCNKAVLLAAGRVTQEGTPEEVIARYLAAKSQPAAAHPVSPYGVALLSAGIVEKSRPQEALESVFFDHSYELVMHLRTQTPVTNGVIVARVFNELGILVSSICSIEEGMPAFTMEKDFNVTFALPHLTLFPGRYTVGVYAYRFNEVVSYLEIPDAFSFTVHAAMLNNAPLAYRQDHGVARISGGGRVDRL